MSSPSGVAVFITVHFPLGRESQEERDRGHVKSVVVTFDEFLEAGVTIC
jgi:hypothetical protein